MRKRYHGYGSDNIEDRRREPTIGKVDSAPKFNEKRHAASGALIGGSPAEAYNSIGMGGGRSRASGTTRGPSLKSVASDQAEKENEKKIKDVWRMSTGGGF